jgi:hypothetical protein
VTQSHIKFIFTFLINTDHKRLYEDLHELAPEWQRFGVHLKVPIDRLKGFQGESSMVDRCFTEVLVAWLCGEGLSCTVEQLVSALGKPGVDQRRLAREIEQNRNGESDVHYLLILSFSVLCRNDNYCGHGNEASSLYVTI